MNFDGKTGGRFQVILGVLVHYEGNKLVLGDLFSVQPLKGIHVPCVLVDPEDLLGRFSSEQVLGVLTVYAGFDLGERRRCELGMGSGGCVHVCV